MNNDLISRTQLYAQICTVRGKDGLPCRVPDMDCDNFPITLNLRDVRRAILKAPAVKAVPAAVQAQLDAAMRDLKLVANCEVCKNAMQNGGCCRGGCRGLVGSDYSFEWRGETALKEAGQ